MWLPLCLLFVAPFFDPRRPFRMLHVDLLVLLGGFGLSHFFFNKGEIGTSVPLVYPVLAYFLARMLVAGFRPRRTGEPLVPFVPAAVLVAGIVLLGGLRIGLDLTEGKVGDVGYASAIGATRIQTHQPLYKDSGKDEPHFDTYGPVNYLAYDPFMRIWKPSQKEIEAPDDYELPAARAAALVFDAFTVLGLFLLGLRLRRGREGRLLGLALAYGWVSFPYTLFPLMSNSNDGLISMLLVYALLALSSPPARGALVALAGAAKFAPLALVPLFATGRGRVPHALVGLVRHDVRARRPARRRSLHPADGRLARVLGPDHRLPVQPGIAVQRVGPEPGARPAAVRGEGGGGRARRDGRVRAAHA